MATSVIAALVRRWQCFLQWMSALAEAEIDAKVKTIISRDDKTT